MFSDEYFVDYLTTYYLLVYQGSELPKICEPSSPVQIKHFHTKSQTLFEIVPISKNFIPSSMTKSGIEVEFKLCFELELNP